MRTSARWGIAICWLLLIGFAVGFDWHLLTTPLDTQLGLSSVGGDFTMYYAAARALRLNPHANIYSLATLHAAYTGGCGRPPTTTYPYQPLLALLLEPLTLLPCSTALYAWWQFSFLLWGAVTFWFARDATRQYGPGRGLLVGALCVFFRPIWNGLEYGQLHLLVLFLLALASRRAASRRLQGAGAVLALGVVTKYIPIIVVAFHLARGRWRVALGAALTGGALLLGELLIVGPGTLLSSVGGATADVATYAALHRSWLTGLPDGVWLARLLLLATFATLLVATARRWKLNEALGEGWVLCALLLALPLAWYHYLTWLLPLMIAILHAALDGARAIRPGFSWEAITRRLPMLGFALIFGAILVPGAGERLVGPALFVLWGLCGALYLLGSARPVRVSAKTPEPSYAVVGRSAER